MTSHMQTSQLLESLHSSRSLLESSIPPGLLIANDSEYKRTHLLIHQTARLPSPAFVVTNVDASIFPTLSLPPDDTAESSRRKNRHLLFDRILCDVPCSGERSRGRGGAQNCPRYAFSHLHTQYSICPSRF